MARRVRRSHARGRARLNYEVLIRPEAKRDIADAVAYYAEKSPAVARRFESALKHLLLRLTEGEPGLAVPDETFDRRFRRVFVGSFPYVVYFHETKRKRFVVLVSHMRRQPGFWRSRLK